MYQPSAFHEDRADQLHGVIRAHPLGTLVTAGRSGLMANAVPFSLVVGEGGAVLRGHLARANDQIEDLRDAAPALILFQGPQAYVSPSWYPTKQEHGKVVPTWNYVVVQARGTPRLVEDHDWLLDQIGALTDAQEAGTEKPWHVSDAPPAFIDAQIRGIIGIEIPIERLDGKWKMSQNQPDRNRRGVIDGFTRSGRPDMAEAVGTAMRSRS